MAEENKSAEEIEETPVVKEEKPKKKGRFSRKKKDDSKEKIEALETEIQESKDKYLRLFAEFENVKKRNTKERFELIKTAGQDIIKEILPVLDDFDRAKITAADDSNEEVFPEGIALVYQKIYTILSSKGLEPMETNGEVFDAELHEAITEIPGGDDMKGKIIDTVTKGYKLHDKIIRFPKVVVGK